MGEPYSIHGRDEVCTTFWSENLKGNAPFPNLGASRRILLKWVLRVIGCEDLPCT
jgi:hypothetical protein